MPDGSETCGKILEQIDHLESSINDLNVEITALRTQVHALEMERERAKGMLSVIGSITLAVLSAIGYIVINGFPQVVKDIVK